MAHPMMGYLQPQMGRGMNGIFDDLLDNLQNQAVKTGKNSLDSLIASTFKTVASDPTVQQAVVASGNEAAIQQLAAQLKAAQGSAVGYVRQNPYTTMMLVGGGAAALLLIFMMMKRR